MKLKKAYRSWMVSYLIIILVALICSIMFYGVVSSAVRTEVDRANGKMLENLRLTLDTYIDDMQKIAADVGSNPVFNQLYEAQSEEDFIYAMRAAQDEMVRYKNINPSIEDIYLYIKDRDYVISPARSVSSAVMYDSCYQKTGVSYEQWKQMLMDVHQNEVIPFYSSATPESPEWNIALLRTVPLIKNEESKATFYVSVQNRVISNLIENADFSGDSFVMLLNERNQVLLSSARRDLPIAYDDLLAGEYLRMKIDGTKYVITSIPAGTSKMKYVLGVPDASYRKTAIFVRNTSFIGIFLFLLIGLFAANRLLKRNYKPLHELMEYVEEIGPDGNSTDNEYSMFRQAITRVVTEKKRIQSKLMQQNETLRDNMLTNLLKGKISDIETEDVLFQFGEEFSKDAYLVLVYYIENYDELFEGSTKEIEEQAALVQLVIENITQELLQPVGASVCLEVNELLVCLVNLDGESAAGVKAVKKSMEEAKQVIRDNFYIEFTLAMSGVHSSAKGIALAYQEAMEALDYKLVIGSGETICYDELPAAENNYSYPIEMELMLMNALKAGDRDKTKTLLNQLFTENAVQKPLSVEMAKCFVSNLVSTFLKVINELRTVYQIEGPVETEIIETILGGGSLREMKAEITKIADRICDLVGQRRDTPASKIAERVSNYIEINFKDPNLSLNSISDELDITPTYLSKVYKMQTGNGLLQRINKLRLDEAARLLGDTDKSVAEIADLVGFTSSNSLIRTFKKYNGITPGKYREFHQK